MLHILLFILKIIGMILAVILGLLVLLICVVLFLPVQYDVEGECKGIRDLYGRVNVRWLFGLICVNVMYKEHKLDYILRIAWKKISLRDTGEEKDEDETQYEKYDEKGESEKDDPQNAEIEKSFENVEDSDEGSEQSKDVNKEESGLCQICEKDMEEAPKKHEEKRSADDEKEHENDATESGDGISIFQRLQKKYEKIAGKLKGICRNIKCTRNRLCDKIKEISDKKDLVSGFISSETHQRALGKLKKEGFRLVRQLCPEKLDLELEYGFGDPGLTGRMLALISMIYPYLGGNIDITPDFQNVKLNGKCLVKGRISIYIFVFAAVRLLLSKDIRQTYKDIKQGGLYNGR